MAAFVTPSHLAQRGDFYHQLSQLVGAGIPLITALESVLESRPPREYLQPLTQMVAELKQGFTFTEVLFNRGKWLPEFDLALISAAENSGRLEETLKILSGFYADRARLLREVISKMMYPLMLVHFAALVFPVQGLQMLFLQGDLTGYLKQKLPFFAGFYGLVFVILYFTRGTRGESVRAVLEAFYQKIPVLGSALKSLAVARTALALEALVSAGVSIITAWKMAGDASGSVAMKREVSTMPPRIDSGETPAEILREFRTYPNLFKSMYQTAEISGTLDTDMRRAYKLYHEEGMRGLNAVADWTPKLAYIMVAIGIAFSIVGFYQQYFGEIQRLIQ